MAIVPTGVARQPRERQEAWPLLVGGRRPRTGRRVSRAPLPASSKARLRAFSPRPSEAAESARWAAGVRAGVSLHGVSTAPGVPGHLEGTRASGSPCAPALVPRSPPSPAGASTLPDPSLFQQEHRPSARPRATVGKARGSWPGRGRREPASGQRGTLPESQGAVGSVTWPQGSVGFSGCPPVCPPVSGWQLAVSARPRTLGRLQLQGGPGEAQARGWQ